VTSVVFRSKGLREGKIVSHRFTRINADHKKVLLVSICANPRSSAAEFFGKLPSLAVRLLTR